MNLAEFIARQSPILLDGAMLHHRTDTMSLSWRRTGEQTIVTGTVLDVDGAPVANQEVDLGTGSGGESGAIDTSGRFRIEVHDQPLYYLELTGIDKIEWGDILGPHGLDGVDFTIRLRRRMPVPGVAPSRPWMSGEQGLLHH